METEQQEPAVAPEVTEEGIQIVQQLLKAWASNADGEDVIMADDVSPEAQLEELRMCVEKFRPQIEGNAWLQEMITSL